MTNHDTLRAALADRYRLDDEIGAGGMATVFLAHDLRHDRKVAIKVLRPELGALLGAERFLKEIRVTANLQHPAILTLHDSGEAAGLLFYVMPYVEGETLRTRLVRETQLPINDAVRIASEIAGALDYAHRHGVLHRDIKPENVLLVEGHALLADFGIALAVREAGGDRLTGTGVSLGTPQYMSPEQAMGDRVLDARTDVYSLAALTYEMLGGTPPHTGPHAQAIIAKLIAEEPRLLTRERPATPPQVAAAVHRGLAKLAADRFQSAAEFSEALSQPGTGAISGAAVSTLAGRRSWKSWVADRRTLAALGLVAATAGLLGASLWREAATATPTDGVVRFDIEPPPSLADVRAAEDGSGLAIAPDDRHVAFTAVRGDTSVIFVRALDRFATYQVPGGEARYPFFSSNGRQLGFIRGSDLWKLNLEGGDVARVAPLGEPGWNFMGLAWHPDGDIFAVGARGIWRVDTKRAESRLVAPNDSASGWGFVFSPTVLPNGRILVPSIRDTALRWTVLSPDGKTLATLPTELERRIAGYANGRLISRTRALATTELDADRLESVGAPIELSMRTLDPDTTTTANLLQISPRGSAVWYDSDSEQRELVWVTRSGSVAPLPLSPSGYDWPRLSPDGHHVAVGQGVRELFVYDLRSGARTQIGGSMGGGEPAWAPDGRTLAFSYLASRTADQAREIALQAADASTQPKTIVAGRRGKERYSTDISADGRWLAVYGPNGHDPSDISIFDRQTGALRTISLPGFERGARFSRDGKFLAYQSNETGRNEIYVQPWPSLDAKWVISAGGGDEPSWSRDGSELFYRSGDRVMAVRVRTSPAFSASPPVELFHGPFRHNTYGDQSYDVAPDGRFLMMRSVSRGHVRVRVVKNWLSEALRSQSTAK